MFRALYRLDEELQESGAPPTSSHCCCLGAFPHLHHHHTGSHTYTWRSPTLTPWHTIISAKQESPALTPAPNGTFLLSPYFAYYFSVEFRMALFAPYRTTRQRKQRFSHSGQSEANLHHYGGIHLWLSRLFAGAPLMETNFHLHSAQPVRSS